MKKITLDSSELEHPKPLELAISILRDLNNDSYMYMINKKNPIPLLKLAKSQSFQTLSCQIDQGEWHILITPNQKVSLQEYVNV